MPTKSSTQFLKPNIRLLVTKGDDQGKVYESNRYPFIIGRDESVDFPLPGDHNISRRHAKISTEEDGSVWIEDLNSTNGCFVNNIRIGEKTELKHGSTIIMGSTWLKFIIFKPGLDDRKPVKQGKDDEKSTFFTETKKVEAILILDLFDSSRLANLYGDEAAMKITEELNSIALPLFNKYRSEFNKGTGDGFLVTFKKPVECLAAAIEILKKVRARNANKSADVKMHIRISLNYGQCSIEPNGDRHGNAVNMAFRVDGVKYRDMKKSKESVSAKEFPDKDRIFTTEEFYNQFDAQQKKKFYLLGNFKLKGISGVNPVYCFGC
jgi:class 3 adenylate cyclase